MKTVLSPKELARSIGVSESSVKRWVDVGTITAARTAGGHRRIPLSEALRFIRATRATIIEPQLLGLSDLELVSRDTAPEASSLSESAGDSLSADSLNAGSGERAASDSAQLLEFLQGGLAPQARGLILSMYLRGDSVADICDGPVRAAMESIGRLWRERPDGVMIEHRATDICLQAFSQLRLVLKADEEGPVAVGGGPSGDPYLLPSLAASAVLESIGFQTINLGPDTPIDTLRQAAEFHQVSLVWLSVSDASDSSALSRDLEQWLPSLVNQGIQVIVGGRDRESLVLKQHENLLLASTMAELAALGHGLLHKWKKQRAG